MKPVANSRNNIRLLTPLSELEEKNLSKCSNGPNGILRRLEETDSGKT
jgi:hypothetical protein